jgi:dipeptidyl aminopeptidase/acylaminoacyl peptidase
VDSTAAPILLVHGEDDPVVPAQRSIDFAERYAQAGVPFELVMFPDAPHDFWNFEEWFEGTMDRAAAFLLTHLTDY